MKERNEKERKKEKNWTGVSRNRGRGHGPCEISTVPWSSDEVNADGDTWGEEVFPPEGFLAASSEDRQENETNEVLGNYADFPKGSLSSWGMRGSLPWDYVQGRVPVRIREDCVIFPSLQ